jgi:serpin B
VFSVSVIIKEAFLLYGKEYHMGRNNKMMIAGRESMADVAGGGSGLSVRRKHTGKAGRGRSLAARIVAALLAAVLCLAAGCGPKGNGEVESVSAVDGNGAAGQDVTEPGAAEPGVTKPGATEPGATKPGATEPGGAAGTADGVKDLMAGMEVGHPDIALEAETYLKCRDAVADYAVRLLGSCVSPDENVMVSPVSVVYALAMVANGAEGETLEEFEKMVGIDRYTLNIFLNMYMDKLKSLDGDEITVNMADSIWFDDDLEVKEAFLLTNAGSLGAEVYQTPFNQDAIKAINGWVEKNTLGMIKKIIDEISEDDMMYIMNAVAAKAKWAEPFKESNTHESEFRTEAGEVKKTDMMHASDDLTYISDGKTVGFIKRYNGGMSFAALLPEEGTSTKDFIGGLTGGGLVKLLEKTGEESVNIGLPKFKSESTIEMKDILKGLGLKRAFERDAELGGISDESLYVGDVLHKTFIKVDEQGTEAAAVTGVMVKASGYTEPKAVILDRPFVYVIFDDASCTPLFIGTYQTP